MLLWNLHYKTFVRVVAVFRHLGTLLKAMQLMRRSHSHLLALDGGRISFASPHSQCCIALTLQLLLLRFRNNFKQKWERRPHLFAGRSMQCELGHLVPVHRCFTATAILRCDSWSVLLSVGCSKVWCSWSHLVVAMCILLYPTTSCWLASSPYFCIREQLCCLLPSRFEDCEKCLAFEANGLEHSSSPKISLVDSFSLK